LQALFVAGLFLLQGSFCCRALFVAGLFVAGLCINVKGVSGGEGT